VVSQHEAEAAENAKEAFFRNGRQRRRRQRNTWRENVFEITFAAHMTLFSYIFRSRVLKIGLGDKG
jgi:hypothetical protein